MNWVMTYEDGEMCSSSDCSWAKLPRGKKISSFGVFDTKGDFHELTDCDLYWFSDTAEVLFGASDHRWVERAIAGFDEELGVGILYVVFLDGRPTVTQEVKLEDFIKRYKKETFINAVL